MKVTHSQECADCDGSGTFTFYDEINDRQDEGNCPCMDATADFELCDECARESAA